MSTKSQKVTIVGPNLRDQSKGGFHVHAAGCADLKHYGRNGKFGGEVDEYSTIDATSKKECVEFVYADHIDEGMSYESGRDDLYFMPCCRDLPEYDAEDTVEDDEEAVEEADAKEDKLADELAALGVYLVSQKDEARQEALDAIEAAREQLNQLEEELRYSSDEDLVASPLNGRLDTLDAGKVFRAYGTTTQLVEFDKRA